MLRVVLLSKALVVGPYQRKAELLANEPDIELTVVVPPLWRDGDHVQRLERRHTRGYRLLTTRVVAPGNFHLHFYPSFGQILDDLRPDLVHIDEEAYNLATFMALRAARSHGAGSLFFTWQNLARRYPPPFGLFERTVHRHADGAIAGSQTAAQVLRAKGYAGQMWVIPQFGVDPDQFRPADEPRPRGPLSAGYVGRLVPGKGVDLLIEALSGLDLPWKLTLAGDGPARADLERLAEVCQVADRVTFRSWLPGSALPDFYRTLDILILPSRPTRNWIEQFGRVLIEAMACGVACVGSDSGEIPYVLGAAGVVFPAGNARALRDALAGLAADPAERTRLATAGRQRVLAQFTMARVAAETAVAYRAIAARRSAN
jgi:glycosyltransferase involved in cell wall biosynthesis